MNLDKLNNLVLSKEKYVIKIGSSWCVPCKTYDKIISELLENRKELEGRIISLDIDECPEIVSRYCFSSIPMTLFINGNVECVSGIISGEKLEEFLG